MVHRKNKSWIANALVIHLLLLGICGCGTSDPDHNAVIVFKCCDFSAEHSEINHVALNTSEPITILLKDLIIPKNATASSNGDPTVFGSDIEATRCHPNENSLTSTFSLHPNKSEQGIYSSGYLRNGEDLYSPHQYCISKHSDNGYTIKLQDSTFCDKNHCIRKCCGPLDVYDLSTYGISKLNCVSSSNNPWSPKLYLVAGANSSTHVVFKSQHPRNWCTDDNVVLRSLKTIGGKDRKSLFRILENGSVIIKERAEWKAMNTSRICIDGAINIPGHFNHNAKQSVFSGEEHDTIILECGPKLAAKSNPPLVLYGTALAISTLFQFSTLLVYGLLWEKQNIHGWTLLGYIITMFLFYISMLSTFFYLYKYPDPDFITEKEVFSSFCGIIAIVTHFLYICTMCWLTIISMDIFLTFRILKLTRAKSKNKMKFLIYLSFTLFVPFVIVCTGVLLDINYGDDPETNIILPRYGWNKCFLDLKKAALPYLFGPIGVLLILNCAMYIATLFHMYKLQESTKFASKNSSQLQKQRAKIRMFSKLFFLMGVSWILEFITFLIFGEKANMVVIIGDIINILQPVAIFIMFVCKKDIMKSLAEKYPFLTKVFSSLEPEESINSTSSERLPRLTIRLWNPLSAPKWFRSRINSTMTETSNLSNQSIKSISINAIDESPSVVSSSLPLNVEMETSS